MSPFGGRAKLQPVVLVVPNPVDQRNELRGENGKGLEEEEGDLLRIVGD